MKEWKSISASAHDVHAIADLARTHYGAEDDTAHAEYLFHEYYENPLGDARVQIAWNEKEQEAGGQFALVPKQVKVGEYIVKDMMSVNTITGEKYRGQGVFTKLARDVLDEIQEQHSAAISHGMPNQNSYPGFTKKLGYTDIGVLPLYIRPLVPSHLVRDFLHWKHMYRAIKPMDWAFMYRREPVPVSGVSFQKLTADHLELAEDFWKEIRNKYPVMIQRDPQYLRYRFLDIPRRKYECWYAVKNHKPVAFVIGRVMEVAGMQCAMIADFLYLDGAEAAARQLVQHILFILQQQGGDLAGCLMQPFTSEAKILKKMGFFVCPKFMEPQPFLFILRVFGDEPELQMVKDFHNWFFTMGDYDVV